MRKRPHWFILIDKEPVGVDDILLWGSFMEGGNRIVQHSYFGDFFVSTVFLGLDHSFMGGPPILFETMVFTTSENCYYQKRYHTWNEAVEGHLETTHIVIPIWRKNMLEDFVFDIVKGVFAFFFFMILGAFLVTIL